MVLFLSMSFEDLSIFQGTGHEFWFDHHVNHRSSAGSLYWCSMLGKRISSKTIYMVVTKPVSRSIHNRKVHSLFILCNLILVGLVFLLSIHVLGSAIKFKLGWAVLLIIMEMGVMVSASLFPPSAPTLAAILPSAFIFAVIE